MLCLGTWTITESWQSRWFKEDYVLTVRLRLQMGVHFGVVNQTRQMRSDN